MEQVFLWLIAGPMAVFTAWLVKRGSTMRTLNDASILLFLLTMMATMFISAVVYLYYPGFTTLIILVAFNMVSMSVFLVPVLEALFFGDRPLEEIRKGSPVSTRTFVVGSAIALVIVSELFMGWTFAIVGGAVTVAGGSQAVYSAVIGASSSYWFMFTMASEMAITLLLVRKKFPRGIGWVVAAQTAVMFLSPTAISNSGWARFSLVAGSAVMIVLFIYVFEFLYRNRGLNRGVLNYLVCLMLAYALMMAGLFVWLVDADASLFVSSVFVEMIVYFYIVLEERKLGSSGTENWQSRPLWVFALLGLLFVAEFFMGAAFDVYAYGTMYFTMMAPMASMGGPLLSAVPGAVYNFVMLFASVTMSPWYLIMMGCEMGALVLFRIRTARELETKTRLALVIVAYAVYSIWLPLFVLPPASLSKIPWLGWSMGLGTAGALAPVVLLALLGTYLVSGGLSFLFGSRNVCSLFCMAALMYQGTAIDSMSTFNRSSSLGRRFLTSRVSSIYKIVASTVWVSLLGTATLSYLSSVGILTVSVFGSDASHFLFIFYFSFLWYLIWMMIPFVGTYGCATTGMCGWGSFNQFVSRLGLFRLRVMDSDLCVRCETKDCSGTCPVGITDQPSAFIARGELRSSRCIGVGDCVSSCPYENIYFYDVRRWLKERLHGGRGPTLPPLAYGKAKRAFPLILEEKKNRSVDARV
jgi:polyferredoxin